MKTTFKKSALAFLTCVLALAFALTGCSGGGKDPKANFVGSWELSGGTLDGEELTDEYMDMLKEWGPQLYPDPRRRRHGRPRHVP